MLQVSHNYILRYRRYSNEDFGKIVDDIPPKDPVYKDLKFFESNFTVLCLSKFLLTLRKKMV